MPIAHALWFTSKPGYSLLEVNCLEEKTPGAAPDIELIVQAVEVSHIEHLVLRHCALLEMPKYLRDLNNLMGLKLYNSSILKWSEDAAIVDPSHPMLRCVFLIDTNMTEFPSGLLSPKFPQKMTQVVISKSNLTEVPDYLDAIWPKRMTLLFEELQLRALPYVLTRLQTVYLSLALNNLTVIPAAVLEIPFLPLLVLNGNPIRSLPTSVTGSSYLGWLSLISMKISSLPERILGSKAFLRRSFISAASTPLCDRMIASGEAAAALSMGSTGLAGIDCFLEMNGDGTVNWYPIGHEETRNPSYTLT